MSTSAPLSGLTVVTFENRRADELARLINHYGGEVVSAPAMREVPLDRKVDLRAYIESLRRKEIDVVILLTGVGLRILVSQLRAELDPQEIATALRQAMLVARGPKPVAALRELGLTPDFVVPSPHTWKELLELLEQQQLVQGKVLALQEYGIPNRELLQKLECRGARVLRVPLYVWDRPEDLAPLRHGITTILEGKAQAVVFTSANQVYSVFEMVQEEFAPQAALWVTNLHKLVVASVGPVCSAALRAHGVEPDLEASPPKMGSLVHLLARRACSLWQEKASRVG